MTMSNTEKKAPEDDLREGIEEGKDKTEENPEITMEAFRAAGVGIFTDEELDDLIACVHEWRHEWIHKSEV
jgi:hypothetical protein